MPGSFKLVYTPDAEVLEAARGKRNAQEMADALGCARSTLGTHLQKHGLTERVHQEFGLARAGMPPGSSMPQEAAESASGSNGPAPEIVGAGPKVEPDVAAIRQNARQHYRAKALRAESKLHQRITFPHGPVALFFCGDQHIGNAGTDVERMYEERDLITQTPGAFVWQMGDPVDAFIVGKLIAENWKPSLPVWEQWTLAGDYFDGFGDRMVAYTGGNHDAWALKLSGMDYRRDICPDGVLYDGDEIKATVRVGNRDFRVWARHRWRGSSIYNPTHGQERAARFDSARHDVYVGAHVHKGAMSREFVLDGQRKVALLSGAYKMHDDYATEQGFPGHDASTAVALVLHDDGSYFACSDLRAALNYMEAVYR